MREQLKAALKTAMLEKDTAKVSALRLILAAIKDRDIASRGSAKDGQITNDDILQLLQSMIKLTPFDMRMTEPLVQFCYAAEDIEFVPESAVREIIAKTGAAGLKDMGAVMAALREQYAGRMDFGQASGIVKSVLAQK